MGSYDQLPSTDQMVWKYELNYIQVLIHIYVYCLNISNNDHLFNV